MRNFLLNCRWGLLACLTLAFILSACSENSNPSDSFGDWVKRIELPDDMVFVAGRKKEVALGTNDSAALAKERPEMKVLLEYEYYLGKHEVTCDEFYALMKDAKKDDDECGKLPVANVSYYDAVLFANERSKKENLDTVYSYSKRYFTENGHCAKLEGLYFNPYAEGYRLPSEAEWLYVASRSWNPKDSWYGGNSSDRRHEVCSGKPDSYGFCDMAGNVMEWCNDWLGFLKDTTINNFAGASDGGPLDERILKGGSYKHDSSAIQLYKRGDVYTVTSSTRASYVGFRLAFGPMYIPVNLGSDGSVNDTKLVSLSDIESIGKKMKAFQAKLALRNDVSGNLMILDYSQSAFSVVEYKDTMEVFHPEFSPNGTKVAYCTKPEGVSGKSEVYVRDIIYGGAAIRLDEENAAIPRWRVLPNGDTAIVYVTDAGNNKEESSWKSQSTKQVVFAYGEFGTPEKLFGGTFNGGISEDASLAVSGARLLRAHVKDVDSLWYNGEQACNVSLSQDGSKRTLFLDFGGETGQKFVGSKYGTHQRLLVADSTGKLIHSVAAPKGYSFDHSEWVINDHTFAGNKTGFAIATLTNANGAHEKIVLVNFADSTILELAEGDELWHPSLWVNKVPDAVRENAEKHLDVDSAAYYYVDGMSSILAQKMNVFWNYADSLKVVGLGSSRMTGGIWSSKIATGLTFNLGSLHVDMDVMTYLAENYVLPHCKNLKYLIVGLDLDLWGEAKGVNLKENLVPEQGFKYDANHKFWKDGLPDGFIDLNKIYVDAVPVARNYKISMGWNRYESYGWESGGMNSSALIGDSTWSDSVKTYKENIELLKEIIAAAKKKDVTVVGLVFPQAPYYKKTGSFGRHGMRRSLAKDLLNEIEALEKTYSNFKFVDENKMGDHGYGDDMAYDYDHLSYSGAKKLTAKLDSLIKDLEK